MKFLTITFFLFASTSLMAGVCKISNNIIKKTGDLEHHNPSRPMAFNTDLNGCLKIAQHNFMSLEHKLQKGYYYAGSSGTYQEIYESGYKEKEIIFIRASNITEPKANNCEGVYTKEKKLFRGKPIPIKIVEVLDEQISIDPVEECIAKTSAVYFNAIKGGKFEPIVVNTVLKSKTGAPYEVIMYGHKNLSGFEKTIQSFIQQF